VGRAFRSLAREARAIARIWWLIVPSGVLGALAILDAVRHAHHKSVWFWAALAMTALWLATCVRLRHVLSERDAAQRQIADERSAEAVAARLDDLAKQWERLKAELRPDPTTATVMDRDIWNSSASHIAETIRSELRTNAPGFLGYWTSDPRPIPEDASFSARSEQLAEMSVEQLRHIATRIREGHDSP
jgi:hypothetical protein